MKFTVRVLCFFKFFDNIYCCQLLGKSRNEFSKMDILRMSKSEISEILFSEENEFFPYAVSRFSCDFVIICLNA